MSKLTAQQTIKSRVIKQLVYLSQNSNINKKEVKFMKICY